MSSQNPVEITEPKLEFPYGIWIASLAIVAGALFAVHRYADPAPPRHLVISTGEGEGNYQAYAKAYQDLMKDDGVTLEIRPSSGAEQNLDRLNDDKSDIQVGFVHDGLGNPDKSPDLSSLGSLYYEPIWIFYRGNAKLTRVTELKGKKFAVGPEGGGTRILIENILTPAGVTSKNTTLTEESWDKAAEALTNGKVDAAAFLGTPDEKVIQNLLKDPKLKLMSLDQAEAIVRIMPYLHHLVLPHGTIDLEKNIPPTDIDLVGPTATLLVKDSIHPALVYLLLKVATEVHSESGIFEEKNEFPEAKDYQFPMSEDAKAYYKSGTPFWHRFFPFWIATIVQRFIFLVIPALAIVLPIVRFIPRFKQWRIRNRVYRYYGELKILESQIPSHPTPEQMEKINKRLDQIEAKVRTMKLPLDHSETLYVLRSNIQFVRQEVKDKGAS